jgi:hypothetical protein
MYLKPPNDPFKRVIINWSCIPRTESRYFNFTKPRLLPSLDNISPVIRKSAELQNFDEDGNLTDIGDTFVSKRYKT